MLSAKSSNIQSTLHTWHFKFNCSRPVRFSADAAPCHIDPYKIYHWQWIKCKTITTKTVLQTCSTIISACFQRSGKKNNARPLRQALGTRERLIYFRGRKAQNVAAQISSGFAFFLLDIKYKFKQGSINTIHHMELLLPRCYISWLTEAHLGTLLCS